MAQKSIVKRLSDEVERLIADHERISTQCRELTAERDKLLKEKRRLEETVRQLETKLQSLELSSVMSGNSGSVERARQRVNSLLREIDRCIAVLKQEQDNN